MKLSFTSRIVGPTESWVRHLPISRHPTSVGHITVDVSRHCQSVVCLWRQVSAIPGPNVRQCGRTSAGGVTGQGEVGPVFHHPRFIAGDPGDFGHHWKDTKTGAHHNTNRFIQWTDSIPAYPIWSLSTAITILACSVNPSESKKWEYFHLPLHKPFCMNVISVFDCRGKRRTFFEI